MSNNITKNMEIRKELLHLAEPEYQAFISKLLPGTENILGIRIPALRKLAKQLVKGDWRAYLNEAQGEFFEEIMLQGMVIGYANAGIDEVLSYVSEFVDKIDNWSVCDSFCSTLKIAKKHPKEMWDFIQPYLADDREYYIRFGVVMLLNYYISEEYADEALQAMDKIKSDAYYVKMGVAWAISMYYVNLPEKTMPYLRKNHLDDFTYNKTLQKITESLKTDQKTKEEIRGMRRKV
ncbi:DNA alkylation repair protein [Konateibacter massiliensis]|uniref:DNA alkylation repair protein n=1 Tax=Konateibacter massiliensis TaxID=2002841 RepID=UPI001F3DC642|nr:DNA alkylation repair protein [Konateibacter massiliensis]